MYTLTSPDPDLELRLVQILHIVPNEPVQQVTNQSLEHHRYLEDPETHTSSRTVPSCRIP